MKLNQNKLTEPKTLGKILAFTILPLVLFILILIIRYQYPIRPVSIAIRYSISYILPITFVMFFILFSLPGWWGKLAGFSATIGLFGLSLSGLWAKMQSEYYILSAVLPFVDANNYFNDARRLLEGSVFSDFSSWRPLFPAFLAPILGLNGQNVQITQAILVGITAICVYLLVQEIQNTHGALVSAFVLTIVFFYYRWMGGSIISENLGISLGSLGFALLWRGGAERRFWKVMLGVLLTTLALFTRLGAFFVLPVLSIWSGWLFRLKTRFSWRAFGAACVAIAIGFGIFWGLSSLTSEKPKLPTDYYATIFYDLATGYQSRYGQIQYDYPEINNLSDDERTVKIYNLAIDQIRKNPMAIINGSIYQWSVFFSYTWYAVYGFLITGTPWLTLIIYVLMYILSGLGLLAWVIRRNDVHLTLIFFTALAVVASVPFVPPSIYNRIRLFASSIPILAALPGIGLITLVNIIKLKIPIGLKASMLPGFLTPTFSVILLLFLTIGPMFVKYSSRTTQLTEINCPEGEAVVYIRHTYGSQVNIIPEHILMMDWAPNVHNGRFKWYLHYMPHYEAIAELETIVHPPATIINGLDLKSGQDLILIADSNLFPAQPGNILAVCGTWSTDPLVVPYHFFKGKSISIISNNNT